MKKTALFILFFSCFVIKAQSLTPTVVASSGDYFATSSVNLSWTLGEVVTDTYIGTNNQLTQGFQQPAASFASVEDFAPEIAISLYPNPTQSWVNLEIENCSENLNVKILDLTGKIIYSDIYQAEYEKKINLENFANGIYFLEISNSKNEKLKTFKIQKS